MLANKKLFIGILILLAYVGIGAFGLFKFSHTSEKPMPNCPYTQNNFSLCENSFDHINNWRQFSDVILPTFLALSFLILGIVLYIFSEQNLLHQNHYFYKWKLYLDNQKSDTYQARIIKWLSLFENSPSLSY